MAKVIEPTPIRNYAIFKFAPETDERCIHVEMTEANTARIFIRQPDAPPNTLYETEMGADDLDELADQLLLFARLLQRNGSAQRRHRQEINAARVEIARARL